ncbi:MAG: redox-regulated ATPase YchF [Clostridia bacterium]|nr:redox-regulated ATPase YchF [Clostridia bacterium]
MKLGVVGLPNVGKSTLFNAITHAGAQAANFPFCTIEPNVGVVAVPDERLDKLAALYNSKKITPASIEFVDIAGLVKGASRGEGLGNKFLSHIREVDAIVHVVRCFEDENVVHVESNVEPIRDIETINLELILSDMESVQKRYDKAVSMIKTGDKKYQVESALLKRILDCLEAEKPVRSLEFDEEEQKYVNGLFLITSKPVIYAANISESDIASDIEDIPLAKKVRDYAVKENSETLVISAKTEEEISELDPEEQQMFLDDLGLKESGLNRLVKASYRLLGLISYLTSGEPETRAWTIKNGTKAPQAAGKIHTDFEKGFIRAEVVDYEVLLECGNYTKAKELGKVRSEGKDYVMKDGDVVLFSFNV